MIKKNAGLMCIIPLICSLFIVGIGVQAAPLVPTPDPPYESAQWGVNIGYIGTWKISQDNGTGIREIQIYSFNITAFEFDYWNSTYWYVMDAKIGQYDAQDNIFNPYFDTKISFVNFTEQYIYTVQNFVHFLPINNSGVMLDWSASALLYPSSVNFILRWLNGSDNIVITSHKATNNNMIQYVKSINGDYIKMFFDDKGVILSMESYHYDNFLDLHVTDYLNRIYPSIPEPSLPPVIPFGNFFIVITLAFTSGLIIYLKRKKILISKY